jgi:hypothetical protein
MPTVGFETLNPSTRAAADPSLRPPAIGIGLCLFGSMYWQRKNTHEQQRLRKTVHRVTTIASRDVTRVLSLLHEFVIQWHNSIKCLRTLSGLNIDLQFFRLPLNYTDWYIIYTVKRKVWCEMNSIGFSRQGMCTMDEAGNICYEKICETSPRTHYVLYQWMANCVPARSRTCRPSFLT